MLLLSGLYFWCWILVLGCLILYLDIKAVFFPSISKGSINKITWIWWRKLLFKIQNQHLSKDKNVKNNPRTICFCAMTYSIYIKKLRSRAKLSEAGALFSFHLVHKVTSPRSLSSVSIAFCSTAWVHIVDVPDFFLQRGGHWSCFLFLGVDIS